MKIMENAINDTARKQVILSIKLLFWVSGRDLWNWQSQNRNGYQHE